MTTTTTLKAETTCIGKVETLYNASHYIFSEADKELVSDLCNENYSPEAIFYFIKPTYFSVLYAVSLRIGRPLHVDEIDMVAELYKSGCSVDRIVSEIEGESGFSPASMPVPQQ